MASGSPGAAQGRTSKSASEAKKLQIERLKRMTARERMLLALSLKRRLRWFRPRAPRDAAV